MFSGMFVLGRIAAADVTAGKAKAQVNPGRADLHAIFTFMAGRLKIMGLLKVLALIHALVDALTPVNDSLAMRFGPAKATWAIAGCVCLWPPKSLNRWRERRP